MIRGIVKNGGIQLLDPLPTLWTEGQELRIEEVHEELCPEGLERAIQELETVIAQTPDDLEDRLRIQAALKEADRIEKKRMRREMGHAG